MREQEENLLQFCARQYCDFKPEAWLTQRAVTPVELASVAVFLGGGGWYGHDAELYAVAEQLTPNAVSQFPILAKQTDFSCSRFASMLRERLVHG